MTMGTDYSIISQILDLCYIFCQDVAGWEIPRVGEIPKQGPRSYSGARRAIGPA